MASNTTKKKTTAKSKTNSSSGKKTKPAAVSAKRVDTSNGKKVNSAGKKGKITEPVPEKEKTNPLILQEAALWLVLAVCILIFISYFGIGGYIGNVISDFCFGVFGLTAYIFPVLLFVSAAFLISNKGNSIAGLKFASSIGLFLCVCSFCALFTDEYDAVSNLTDLYEMGAFHKSGGGVLGGSICGMLNPALGSIGTGIILLILSIVFLLLITQKSFIRGMKHQSSRMYHSAKESSARRKEAHRQERAQREEWQLQEEAVLKEADEPLHEGARVLHKPEPVEPKYIHSKRQDHPERTEIDVPVLFPVHTRESRVQRRVSGVTTDTKISGNPAKVGAEIHEIAPRRASHPSADHQGVERETSYIDLEKKEHLQQENTVSGLEVYPEPVSFPIEGIEEEQDKRRDTYESAEKTRMEKSAVDESDPVAFDDIESDDLKTLECHSEKLSVEEKNDLKDMESGTEAETENMQSAHQQGSAPTKKNPRSSQKEIEEGIASVEAEMAKAAEKVRPQYVFPPLTLLKRGKGKAANGQEQEIRKTAAKLQQTLESFGVRVTITNVSCGPSVTRYELQPEQGIKVSRIVSLSDDIKLNLAASDIRIEAPIPGKAAIGIEVPNSENSAVALRDLLESEEFKNHPSKLAFATGKDISGKVVVSDIAKMPHLLIAGATGSGKSVCINTLIMSILYKASPEDVKLIMIDPKVVELSVYNGIPHLFIPVVTDPKKAAGALNWGVAEMTDRYNKFAEFGVRDLKGYNKKIEALKDVDDENKPKKLPQIVIIVDELADLMMVAPGEVEDSICRLAQLARAAGIHLIIATQRPSVNVITGLIKANMPSRIAFSVTSSVDSRTIIDMGGAEKLLGKGDMLFYPQGYQKPARVQGAFVSDEEVSDVVDFLKNKNTDVSYSAEIEEQIAKVQSAASASRGEEDNDALFADAGKFIIEKDKASIGMLQRVFKIGFNRAARIMDQLSEAGVVGPEEGTKPRKILMSMEQFENYLEQN